MSPWDCLRKAACLAPPLLFRATLVFDLIVHAILLLVYYRLMDVLPTAYFAFFFAMGAFFIQSVALVRSTQGGPEKYTGAEFYALCRKQVYFFHSFAAALIALKVALDEGPGRLLEFQGAVIAGWLLFQLTLNFAWSLAFERAVDVLVRAQEAQPVPENPDEAREEEVWGD